MTAFDRAVLRQLLGRMLDFALLLAAMATLIFVLYAIGARVYVSGYEAGYGVGASRSVNVMLDGKVAHGLVGRPLWVTAELCEDTARVRRAKGRLP